MPPRVHVHTDCYWFGGSELTLMALIDALADGSQARLSFSYRGSAEYDAGLAQRMPEVEGERLRLPAPGELRAVMLRALGGGRALEPLLRAIPLKQLCFLWDVVALWLVLRRTKPDILHVNNGGFPGAVSCNAAVLAARLARVRSVVYVVNNLAEPYGSISRKLDRPVDRLVVNGVDRFVTGSHAAAAALRDVLQLDPAKTTVIPNTIVPRLPTVPADATRRRLGIPDGALVVFTPARFEPRKGHTHLLDALAKVRAELAADVVAVLAGDGPERPAMEAKAAATGLGHAVVFAPDEPSMWDLYAVADVVALPSIGNEDFPIVILEAMAAGKPVVATTVAGIPEQVVDGVTGSLVPPADPGALAAALVALLGDGEARAAQGQAARQRFLDCFDPPRAVERYLALYAEVLR